jgi:glycosyltransferase involved in cell wall biosynthesis
MFGNNTLLTLRDRKINLNEPPFLSIFCWVYNDVEFIKICIENILEQQTTFSVEIILHDDASNDGTQEIILEYEKKYPSLFNNILYKENQWSIGKNVMLPIFEKPRGKYIAFLHGDDYWTDPMKLQKQVTFLDKNIDYSMCFHKISFMSGDTEIGSYYKDPPNKILSSNQVILNHYIPTSSLVLRREDLSGIKALSNNFYFNDIYLEILLSFKGSTFYFSEKMGVYRKNISSVSHNAEYLSKGRNGLILLYSEILKYAPLKNKMALMYKLAYNLLGKILDKIKVIIK